MAHVHLGRLNFRFMALYMIGRALGLGDSDNENSVMAGKKGIGATESDDPELTRDDIDGIRVGTKKGEEDEYLVSRVTEFNMYPRLNTITHHLRQLQREKFTSVNTAHLASSSY